MMLGQSCLKTAKPYRMVDHTSDDDYKDAATVSDEVVNALHFLLKEKEIKSIDDLLKILEEENLKSLAKALYL